MPLYRLMSALVVVLFSLPLSAGAQDRRDEQFYYPGRFNWAFLKTYPEGGRLFNAFDYGHAVLYERLLTEPASRRAAALEKEYRFLTTNLLIRPPRFAVAEEVIEPVYAKLAWQAKQMFDWAHVLHRQIYDIYADERLAPEARDSLIERVTDYYLSRKDYAFASVPKSMTLMDEQYFSQGFRTAHPKFNGLIWAYHWLQVGLYEPLILGKTPAEKKAGVKATLARFWSMLEAPPGNFPGMMPMTAAIAPRFSAKHPRAAVIFDNLHMMHDIISDILIADTIPRDRKRAVIYEQLAEFRDGSRNVISMNEWHDMAGGVGMMGGPATGLLVPPPAGGHMGGMQHGTPGAAAKPDTAAHEHPSAPGDTPSPDTTAHVHRATSAPAPVPDAAVHVHPPAPTGRPAALSREHEHDEEEHAAAKPGPTPARDASRPGPDAERLPLESGWLPMHSGHPLVVHFPLVVLMLAVVLDGIAVFRGGTGWRSAATLLWWVGLVGAAAAIGTGLVAYGRVDHSDAAHEVMTRHRNLALLAVTILLIGAIWRWRRPLSRGALTVGAVGALGLGAAGYLGGEMVYRHALGIPTGMLRQVGNERAGYDEEEMRPNSMDTTAAPVRDTTRPAGKPHTHAPGKDHDE
jgi:uncharacterized membrane protein